MNIILPNEGAKQQSVKIINMDNPSEAKAYLSRPPEDTHSVSELDALHRAIRYTHRYMDGESKAKMDEEENIIRPVPKL